jgi:hypothetical protein
LAVARVDGGKIRVTSLLWPEPKVILKDEVPEIRNVDGPLHIARKVKPPGRMEPADRGVRPYRPGDEFIDD